MSMQAHLLRDAFGAFMTGVTVVTCLDEAGKPLGFTANSFASVSLDRPFSWSRSRTAPPISRPIRARKALR